MQKRQRYELTCRNVEEAETEVNGHRSSAETLKKFDKDGNGELSVDERNAAREAMKASRSEGEKRQGKKN